MNPRSATRLGPRPDDSGPLPQFQLELSDADATLEWRGGRRPTTLRPPPAPKPEPIVIPSPRRAIQPPPSAEIVTDVTMELLPDESAAALPDLVAQAIKKAESLAPVAIEYLSPDASLEFPYPVSPELFEELADGSDEQPVAVSGDVPRWKLFAIAGGIVAAAVLAGAAVASRPSEPVVVTSATELPVEAKPIEKPPVPMPDPEPILAAKATTATIVTPAWAKGRRVWLDGKMVGETPKLDVACGKHRVKIGTAGKTRSLDLACGETIKLTP